jgi:hypothetical protein
MGHVGVSLTPPPGYAESQTYDPKRLALFQELVEAGYHVRHFVNKKFKKLRRPLMNEVIDNDPLGKSRPSNKNGHAKPVG